LRVPGPRRILGATPQKITADPALESEVTMNASNPHAGIRFSLATLTLLAACASSGSQRPAASDPPTTAQAGATGERRTVNPFVLTAAEIAAAPNVMNAEDAVRTLRPHFLRTRGPKTNIGRAPLGAGASGGRRSGQGQGGQPAGSAEPGREEDSQRARGPAPPEDPGIVVYLDQQRYGGVQTLREIPVGSIEEIRFLNVGEANSLFGMGHPHGVIQIISRRGLAPR
jgi:hypothetical protein